MPYIPNRWDIQDNRLNKEYENKALVFCYEYPYNHHFCESHYIEVVSAL
ncbi:hypothetical protein ALC57_17950 [Trachymyrmex cornetzi]|uniref:Uncharacterized protein n=1 Tax=Trachymyrmex cornetzi TaxID=471704 RepID=A0A195DAS3_9HYME|nr:hypothetical protein ALC57_17950 [Trachymyrmex cornetzi]